jgi:hypothetical protein
VAEARAAARRSPRRPNRAPKHILAGMGSLIFCSLKRKRNISKSIFIIEKDMALRYKDKYEKMK